MKFSRHPAPTAATHLSIKLAIVSDNNEGWKPKLSSGPCFCNDIGSFIYRAHFITPKLNILNMKLHHAHGVSENFWTLEGLLVQEVISPSAFTVSNTTLILYLAAVAFLKGIV